MAIAYLSLGTNLGDRLANLEQAVAAIEYLTGSRARVSPVYESEAWGYDSPNDYLNIAIAIDWDGDPYALLDITQSIERQLGSAIHRDSEGNYIDRLIDIDIISIGDIALSSPRLILPHPRAHLRPFVLKPLSHIKL